MAFCWGYRYNEPIYIYVFTNIYRVKKLYSYDQLRLYLDVDTEIIFDETFLYSTGAQLRYNRN